MRADARKNYDQLLAVAREVIQEDGVDASLRDIARRANVTPPTLFRHFPTRDALLEALLRATLDDLTRGADALSRSHLPDDALKHWIRDAVAFVQTYSGVVALMARALADTSSALHASCEDLRSAGARLLHNAQTAGVARRDLDGIDLFALIGALGWIGDQPSFASRADHISRIILKAILGDESYTERP